MYIAIIKNDENFKTKTSTVNYSKLHIFNDEVQLSNRNSSLKIERFKHKHLGAPVRVNHEQLIFIFKRVCVQILVL